MIIAEQKPLAELKRMIGDSRRVLVAGCQTCVAECAAGGEREVEILASALRMACARSRRGIRRSAARPTRSSARKKVLSAPPVAK